MPPQYCPGYVFTVEEWDGAYDQVVLDECFRSGVTMVYLDGHGQGPFGPDWKLYTRHRVSWKYLREVVREFHGKW